MTGIKKVIIQNFQSHENTVLEFDEGLNVIVGPSDQGKSAVLRAIKWVLYNEPRGMEFIRHGASKAKVTLEMNNGYSITRERSSSKNRYIVKDPEGNDLTLEGFGNEVPEEVIKAHGIPKVMLDNDLSASLNMGDQLEGPFLLSESGAVRAKAIGRLTGLHVIDRAIRDGMVDLRRENQSLDRSGRELEEVNTKLEDYRGLDELEKSINTAASQIEKLEGLIKRLERLRQIVERQKLNEDESTASAKTVNRLSNLEACRQALDSASNAQYRLQRLVHLKEGLNLAEVEMADFGSIIDRTGRLNECNSLLDSLNMLRERYEKLRSAVDVYDNVNARLLGEEGVLRATKEVEGASDAVALAGVYAAKLQKAVELYKKAAVLEKDIGAALQYLAKSSELEGLPEVLEGLENSKTRLERMEDCQKRYGAVEESLEEGNKYLSQNSAEAVKLEDQLRGLLRQAGRCPFCGSKVDDHTIDGILSHYR